MPSGYVDAPRFEIAGKTRVGCKIHQFTVSTKRIDDAKSPPLNDTIENVTSHHKRELAVILHVQRFIRTNKGFISASSYTDADLATSFFQRWK